MTSVWNVCIFESDNFAAAQGEKIVWAPASWKSTFAFKYVCDTKLEIFSYRFGPVQLRDTRIYSFADRAFKSTLSLRQYAWTECVSCRWQMDFNSDFFRDFSQFNMLPHFLGTLKHFIFFGTLKHIPVTIYRNLFDQQSHIIFEI